jgi:hypothetical protein
MRNAGLPGKWILGLGLGLLMDQTCNDDLLLSSLRGRCVENGRCVCGAGGISPASGKCL